MTVVGRRRLRRAAPAAAARRIAVIALTAAVLAVTACSHDQDAARVEVGLWHCGIEPLRFEGRFWEVPPPSFDATNAPSIWRGEGVVHVVDDRLYYTGDSGLTLTLVPGDGKKPDGCI